MFRCSLWAVVAAGVLLSVGCGFQPGASQTAASVGGGLAVIDLDQVAKEIGRNTEINDSWQVRKNALDQALLKLQNNFNEQIQAKKAEFGETPTDEQKQQLANMQRDGQNKLVQAGRKAQADLEQYRQQMVARFRDEVRPYAKKVAADKGLAIVIPKNEGFLLSIDPAVDITNDVIAAYTTQKPAPTAAPQPAMTPPAPQADDVAAQPQPTETR